MDAYNLNLDFGSHYTYRELNGALTGKDKFLSYITSTVTNKDSNIKHPHNNPEFTSNIIIPNMVGYDHNSILVQFNRSKLKSPLYYTSKGPDSKRLCKFTTYISIASQGCNNSIMDVSGLVGEGMENSCKLYSLSYETYESPYIKHPHIDITNEACFDILAKRDLLTYLQYVSIGSVNMSNDRKGMPISKDEMGNIMYRRVLVPIKRELSKPVYKS